MSHFKPSRLLRAAVVSGCIVASISVACGGAPIPDPATALPAPPSSPGSAAPAAPTPKMAKAECDKLIEEAQSEMDAEHIQVDHPCKADADCEPVKGHACDFTCVDGAIPKGDHADWEKELQKTIQGPCKTWADNDCTTTSPHPAPACDTKKKVACKKGHCKFE